MIYVGIDISKDFFDCVFTKEEKNHHKQFDNNEKGFAEAIAWVGEEAHWTMEATGPYFQRFAYYLASKEMRVSVINPLVIKRYMQMELQLAKTDKRDAMYIADYARLKQPEQWQMPSKEQQELRDLVAWSEALKKTQRQYENRCHAYQHAQAHSAFIDEKAVELLAVIAQQLADVEAQIATLIKAVYPNEYGCLLSIPSVGPETAVAVLALTDGLKHFENAKQLVAYTGLAPRVDRSGNRKTGCRRIAKRGNGNLRRLLYMCSWTGQRYNPACRALAKRLLAKGKAKRQIKMAIAAKLLRQIFAVVKSGNKYDEKLAF